MADDDQIRREIWSMLAGGLVTEVMPRADTHEQVLHAIHRLREDGRGLAGRLIIGGFTLSPVEHEGLTQLCETCMYYHTRRRWCVLPELDVPVEPEWSCRLWRI